jgi:signal transduction histidine kinase
MSISKLYWSYVKIGLKSDDSEETSIQKGFLASLALFMSFGGILWGTIAAYYELYFQSIFPYAYVVISFFNMLYFYYSKEIKAVRFIQILISLLLPFLFQWTLGGFFPSGTMMLWAVLAIVASLSFQSIPYSAAWLGLYVALTIFSGVFDDYFSTLKPEILADISLPFLVTNVSVISSIVFGLVVFYVFRYKQAEQKLNEEKLNLAKSNELLKKSEQELSKSVEKEIQERRKVEYLNQQAQTVFKNVEQGIFLLRSDFTISELYSKSLEEILGTTNLAGANLIQLLTKRLVKKDLESFEVFSKMLFKETAREKLLKKANPLEEVEIFIEKEGSGIISKHLKITFNRILIDGKIAEVLVNVIDQTQAVNLQNMIQQSDEKNKKQSIQLLSILKVNPIVLKDFLDNTSTSLNEILKKYESSTDEDIRGLLDYTFVSIHNLKGNAYLIELDLIGEKLHEIENIIQRLKEKGELNGKDFLPIVIEMDEIKKDVQNMNEMFLRIKQVNTTMVDAENNVNHTLFESLRNRAEKLSKEAGKKVEIHFDDSGIPIAEELRIATKDILVQLVSNSIIHGLETPSTRKELEKDETGKIHVKFREEDNELLIEYQDDGSGINLDKVKEKVLSEHIMSDSDFEKLSEREQQKLIFEQGLSTADTLSKSAGRGQGMSLVKQVIDTRGGSFQVDSKAGRLFRLQIQLPVKEALVAN